MTLRQKPNETTSSSQQSLRFCCNCHAETSHEGGVIQHAWYGDLNLLKRLFFRNSKSIDAQRCLTCGHLALFAVPLRQLG